MITSYQKTMQISYHVEELPEKTGYVAYCPVMKPVSVYGKTKEAVENKISEAIKLYLEKHPELKEQLGMLNLTQN